MIQEDSAGNPRNPTKIYKCVRKVEVRVSVGQIFEICAGPKKKQDVSRHIRFALMIKKTKCPFLSSLKSCSILRYIRR